jgi:hypothetical protein
MDEKNNFIPFGKRHGIIPMEIPFQLDFISTELRTELWNAFYIYFQENFNKSDGNRENIYLTYTKQIWISYLVKPLDDFPNYSYAFGDEVRNYIEKYEWYQVYQLIEFVFRTFQNLPIGIFNTDSFIDYINTTLKKHNAGYIISNFLFIPITNNTEIQEIELTNKLARDYNYSGIQRHLSSSLELISKKPSPDLRNSIKESISMVEVIARIIEPSQNTLGKALNKLDKNDRINSSLKSGFEKLYHYTNDSNGIRHGLMDDEEINIEDARFMLVSCSAFTNYLIEKAIKLMDNNN